MEGELSGGSRRPASTTLDKLTPWNESADEGVKYFSGNGTYTKTINASADWWKKDGRVWLDLGDVKNLAEVKVNGQSVGTVARALSHRRDQGDEAGGE